MIIEHRKHHGEVRWLVVIVREGVHELLESWDLEYHSGEVRLDAHCQGFVEERLCYQGLNGCGIDVVRNLRGLHSRREGKTKLLEGSGICIGVESVE